MQLTKGFVSTQEKHRYYARNCEHRKIYKALITGENTEPLLRRFVRREDDEAFAQRVALTISITPAVCDALMKPFNKVMRSNKVKKNFDFKSATVNKAVARMRETFYGRTRSNNKGLDYWLKTRYPILSFVDPNSWVINEWKPAATAAEILKPYPFEITSDCAWNWSVINEEVKWLWAHCCITYSKLVVTKGKKKESLAAGEYTDEAGNKFTLYDEDYTLVFTQVDKDYLTSTSYVMADNEELWQNPATKDYYIIATFEPKLGFVPGFRVGYVADNETDGETCVNAFHSAMPYLMKSVKTVSELDLTTSLHTFPQKMQYVQKCPGVESTGRMRRSCNYGKADDGTLCSACKGAGYKIHTSAQDALLFPFPEAGTPNNEIMDLEKLLIYKAPPMDLLTFQKDYVTYLKSECEVAVFGKANDTKTTSPGGGNAVLTATEINKNMQGIYDAIFGFTEKVSEIFIDEIFTFGCLAGANDAGEYSVTCKYPPDPKMKSIDDLLVDLKSANDAGAPAILRDKINNDIAEILYEGDELAEIKYSVKHRFFPFNGQSADEIALNVASQYVSQRTKVLYANFESIFIDIDFEQPDFWLMTYDEQDVIVDAMVQEYMLEITDSQNAEMQLPVGGIAGAGAGLPAGDNSGASGGDPNAPGVKPGDPGYVEPNPVA